MKLHGGTEIAAPPRDVWDFVLDPRRLASCVPGIGEVHQVDDRTFDGTILVAVGPMHGEFAFSSVIVRAEFPDDLRVEIVGTDSVTHSGVTIAVAAGLATAGQGTRMDYELRVDVSGRLAILGEMILRATAGAVVAQVSSCIRARVEGAPAGAAVGEGR